jgi:hypothetical protein
MRANTAPRPSHKTSINARGWFIGAPHFLPEFVRAADRIGETGFDGGVGIAIMVTIHWQIANSWSE